MHKRRVFRNISWKCYGNDPSGRPSKDTKFDRQTDGCGGKIQLEHRARRKDGAVIWVSVSAHSADMKGQRVYFASCLDITQSRRNLLEAYEAKRDAELISIVFRVV